MNPIIHEPVRLRIMVALAKHSELSFKELLEIVSTTEGNLSRHLTKLEEAGYVEIRKFFEGKKPKTVVKITESGRKALEDYIQELEKILKNVQK
uniref:ArsR family transcriptional regulator n=1 Tax=candidate division WOR-3 bacterium TaxID=2052148 RepID=A0A7V3ZWQ7_UNCW3